MECGKKEIILRKCVLLCLLLCSISSLFAQPTASSDPLAGTIQPNIKKVNFGIRAGFNSSMYLVSSFKLKDVSIQNLQNKYKAGYFGAFFMRININRHYIQPEISYNMSKCEVLFDKNQSQHPDIQPDYASVISTIRSIDVPILYGYNLIKNRIYGMSLFAGPKFRYMVNTNDDISFENFDQKGIRETLYPFTMNFVVGVSVSISRIFFDFRYEQGLHNISKQVTYDNINDDGTTEVSNILFHRREQVLSFSLGVMF